MGGSSGVRARTVAPCFILLITGIIKDKVGGTSGGVGTRGEDPQGASWSLAPAIYLLCCSCLANL